MQEPELPKLPPMESKPSPLPASSPPPSQPAANSNSSTVSGGKRLKQMVLILAGGPIGLVAAISVAQLTLKPEFTPGTLLATIEAQTELGLFNQKLGEERGVVKFTEADYRQKLAEAERSGQAKAELTFQKNLALVQADKERVVGAYQTLYQRTNIIAQAGVQMESQALQFRQRLIEQTNGGRAVVISVLDGLCAFGDQTSCESARQARKGMMEESGQLTEGDVAKKVRELMSGIPDPATLVANRDINENGTPTIRN